MSRPYIPKDFRLSPTAEFKVGARVEWRDDTDSTKGTIERINRKDGEWCWLIQWDGLGRTLTYTPKDFNTRVFRIYDEDLTDDNPNVAFKRRKMGL